MPGPENAERGDLDRTIEEELGKLKPESAQQIRPIVKDPKFRQAFEELRDRPEARGAAAADPRAYLTRKGLNIPKKFRVEITENLRILICIDSSCCGFSTEQGFYCFQG